MARVVCGEEGPRARGGRAAAGQRDGVRAPPRGRPRPRALVGEGPAPGAWVRTRPRHKGGAGVYALLAPRPGAACREGRRPLHFRGVRVALRGARVAPRGSAGPRGAAVGLPGGRVPPGASGPAVDLPGAEPRSGGAPPPNPAV